MPSLMHHLDRFSLQGRVGRYESLEQAHVPRDIVSFVTVTGYVPGFGAACTLGELWPSKLD